MSWLLLTPLLPLALAMLLFLARPHAGLCRWILRLAPWSMLPALLTGMLAPSGSVSIDAVLLGMQLGLDGTGRVFLLFSAAIWLLAMLYAQHWHADDPQRVRVTGFMLAAASGNLGLCVAQDVVSFYWLFALMTLSTWPLVLHRATAMARLAGTVYLVLAVFGETALLVALFLIVSEGGMLVADAPAVVAASGWRDVIMLLLLTGFGAKTGLLGLHVVLPLAYAASPVPAAAVLASAMIKAGLLGWLRFLPFGYALPEWGTVFIAIGMAAALYGVVFGMLQTQPRSLLGYSSISQMGLITAGVGLGLLSPQAAPLAVFALTLYALHHALVKAALFLGEGLHRSTQGVARKWVFALLLLPALVLAGAPLTSGALAKAELKALLAFAPWPQLLTLSVTLAGIGTTLLVMRLLWLVRQTPTAPDATPRHGLLLPWLAVLGLVLSGGWWLAGDKLAPLRMAAMLDAAWPLLLGALLALAGARVLRGRTLTAAPGDVMWLFIAVGRRSCSALGLWLSVLSSAWCALGRPYRAVCARLGMHPHFERLEGWLRLHSAALGLVIVLLLALLFVLA